MKKLFKSKKFLVLSMDVLLVPFLLLCKWLSTLMLTTSSECLLLRFGGKCVACGGTHFVKALLSGQIIEAFHHNAFLFILTIVLVVSFVLLNLYWLFGLKFAGKVLSKIYCVRGLIIATAALTVFFIIRVAPIFIRLITLIIQLLSSM